MFRILIISIISIYATHAQITIPALSPSSSTTQTIGLTNIDIEYSRPSKRDRVIYGQNGLLPYGEFWRTGANAATKITLSDDITIQNTTIKKGVYTVLTKPGEKQWEVYFYEYQSSNWNSYINSTPITSFKADTTILTDAVETFIIYFDQINLDNAQLVFAWDTVKIKLPIRVEVHKKAMASIEKTLSGPTNFNYFQAALYLHETQQDLDKALLYIQKVTKSPNPLFFQVYREALILADLDKKEEALDAAKKSLALSKEAGNKDFIRLNEKFIEKWSR